MKTKLSLIVIGLLVLAGYGYRGINSHQVKSKNASGDFSGLKFTLKERVFRTDAKGRLVPYTQQETQANINQDWRLGDEFGAKAKVIAFRIDPNKDRPAYQFIFSDCTEVINIKDGKGYLKHRVEDYNNCDQNKQKLLTLAVQDNQLTETYCFETRKKRADDGQDYLMIYRKCLEPVVN